MRFFVQENHELFVAQSFAKNMGLYSNIMIYIGFLVAIVNRIDSFEQEGYFNQI